MDRFIKIFVATIELIASVGFAVIAIDEFHFNGVTGVAVLAAILCLYFAFLAFWDYGG